MGLEYGCNLTADEAFGDRHKLKVIVADGNKAVHFRRDNWNIRPSIHYMMGDCTASTLYCECHTPKEIGEFFPIIQEYMSMNARISAFFTLKIQKSKIQSYLDVLSKFPIAGLHLQKSNREPESNYYMLSGILKVPTPLINKYHTFSELDYPVDHNHLDVTKINQINSEYKLQTF